jgi:hypothetical protein
MKVKNYRPDEREGRNIVVQCITHHRTLVGRPPNKSCQEKPLPSLTINGIRGAEFPWRLCKCTRQ